MFMIPKRHSFVRLLALGWLLAALAGQQAWAVGGGSPDPQGVPLITHKSAI